MRSHHDSSPTPQLPTEVLTSPAEVICDWEFGRISSFLWHFERRRRRRRTTKAEFPSYLEKGRRIARCLSDMSVIIGPACQTFYFLSKSTLHSSLGLEKHFQYVHLGGKVEKMYSLNICST